MTHHWIIGTSLLLVACGLSGCAQKVWTKDGATVADFERDKSACMFQVSASSDPILAAMFLPDCLRGRGYTQAAQ